MFTVCVFSDRAEQCPNFKDRARFLEMPVVKVGDSVWVIRNYKGVPHPQNGEVAEVFFNKQMRLMIVVKHIARGEWGKTVFLTRAEAEKALEERRTRNEETESGRT